MYKFSRIMVYLQGNEADKQLIEHVGMVSKKVEIDSVYFLHVAKSLDLPEDLLEKYPNLLAPVDESIKSSIDDLVKETLPDHATLPYHVIVEEGSPLKVMLKRLKQKEVDLLIISIDNEVKAQEHLAEKLVQFAQCSVGIFPKRTIKKVLDFEKLLVPIDFSSCSKMALETALYLSLNIDSCKIICQHVFTMPIGYHTSGKSPEEFAEIMKQNAQKNFEQFIGEIDTQDAEIEVIYTLDDNDEPSDKINEIAIKEQVDGIVMGANGRTEAAALLLGSTTEKLLRYHQNLPTFVVKDKKGTLGFFDALMKL